MKSTIRLFKAVKITSKRKKKSSKGLLEKTVKRGFVFTPEVVYNYPETELLDLINIIEKEVGLTPEKMNASFHKSWKKVRDADILQLFFEQIIHYFTTYGFERMGIYDKDSVYIPNEKLEIPGLKEDVKLVVIKGYTKEELKKKLLLLLQTGIALGEETINDVIDVATYVEIDGKDIDSIKNKEVKVALYDYLDLFPENPIEFLRYCIYKSTNNTLLIKDRATIEAIKSNNRLAAISLFRKYKAKYGLERLAEIFYRFKPLFLAFGSKSQLKKTINRIRRLALKHHKPMPEDFLNEITAKLKRDEDIDFKKLQEELKRVNTFRQIRLAYALKYRTKDVKSILYRIRNGKAYATNFTFDYNQHIAKDILKIVLDSIVKSIKPNVKGKKIYIPEYMTYSLPATEKQFTGDYPSGSYISIPKDMVVGIHWENVNRDRIDLDLSMINAEGKIGWDAGYRSEDRKILFSGDVTDAPKPEGASELFYVRRQSMDSHILFVNYYNYDSEVEVPLKIFVAKEQVSNLSHNYMVNPNNIITIAKTKMTLKEKILGLLVTTTNECRFYFAETYLGGSITSSNSKFVDNARKYLFHFYRNTISLNELLQMAGGKLVVDKEKCDIDLSPENLEKDKIINLIK